MSHRFVNETLPALGFALVLVIIFYNMGAIR